MLIDTQPLAQKQEASRSSQSIESEEKDYHLSKLRRVAEATVDFVCSLSEENLLSEFWWPCRFFFLLLFSLPPAAPLRSKACDDLYKENNMIGRE